MQKTAGRGRERTLSLVAVVIGTTAALLAPRVVPIRSEPAPPRSGIVVVGPLGLRTPASPAR